MLGYFLGHRGGPKCLSVRHGLRLRPKPSGSNVHSLKTGPLMLFCLVVFLVSTIVAISLIKDRDSGRYKRPNRKRAIRFFGFVSLLSIVGMAVLSSPPDKREPEPTPIFTPEPAKAEPAAQGHKAASSSTKQSPIDIVSASLGDNELQIRAADLRSVPNPKGQGVFVYVRKPDESRYIFWMVIDGKAYAMNGPTKSVTPHLLWPREAPADTWRKTALDKYTVTEAINIVFPTKNVEVKRRAPRVQTGQQKGGSFTGRSPTCGPIVGNSRADLQNVKRFCSKAVVKGTVVGVYAKREILWVKINEGMARDMTYDSLGSERMVKLWMKGWKMITGSQVVTVYVEWGDIEIAKGQTTAFSGDTVSFKK